MQFSNTLLSGGALEAHLTRQPHLSQNAVAKEHHY